MMYYQIRFGTIRNNTALKHDHRQLGYTSCFGTIRNNTALKQVRPVFWTVLVLEPFETTQL